MNSQDPDGDSATSRHGRARSCPAAGSEDLRQVPEHDPGVVPGGLEPVVAAVGGDRLDGDQQARLSGDAGGQPPGSVSPWRPILA